MSFEFAVELKKARISTRKNQADFALSCDVNASTYKAWESGRAVPNFENFNKIYDTLVDLDILVDDLAEEYERAKLGVLKNVAKR